MNLVGLTPELVADGEKRCPGGFRAWLSEVQRADWANAEAMLTTYPKCWWIRSDRYHFSLGPDDFGIRAEVYFDAGIVIAHHLAPADFPTPAARRAARPSVPAA